MKNLPVLLYRCRQLNGSQSLWVSCITREALQVSWEEKIYSICNMEKLASSLGKTNEIKWNSCVSLIHTRHWNEFFVDFKI